VSDRLPNEIDRHIASRVRLRRREMGLNQKTVAKALGVTFQQFQKYERSINRLSAGALYPLALTQQVPVGYFFEGPPQKARGSRCPTTASGSAAPSRQSSSGRRLKRQKRRSPGRGAAAAAPRRECATMRSRSRSHMSLAALHVPN